MRRNILRVVDVVCEKSDGPIAAPITSDKDAVPHFRAHFGNSDRERFVVMVLNGRDAPTHIMTCSIGSLTCAVVHPREVFKVAIIENAKAIIVAHNHPSGDTKPSREDDALTRKLYDAGKLMGIEVLDHVILGDDDHYSYNAAGRINPESCNI